MEDEELTQILQDNTMTEDEPASGAAQAMVPEIKPEPEKELIKLRIVE